MWLALFAAFMLLRTVDTGFVSYVGNKINLLYHQDRTALRETVASSIVGTAVIGVLQLFVAATVIYGGGVAWLLGVAPTCAVHHQAGAALFMLIGTWILSGSYVGIVHRLLIPTGMMYQATWWSMAYQACQFVGIMGAAVMNLTLFQASIMFAFIQSSIYFASAAYIRYKLPEYYPWWNGLRPAVGIGDLWKSIFLTLSSMLQQGTSNGIVMLVSVLSGPAAVPAFTTVRTLTNLWTNATNVLTTPLLPDVVRYRAKREGYKLLTISQAHWVLISTFINLGILVTYPLIDPLYGYWTIHAVPLNKPLLCLLLSSIALANAGALIGMYLNGINSLRVVFLTSLVRGLTSLTGGGVLLAYFGFAGLGFAILVGELLALVIMGYFFVRIELAQLGVRLPIPSLSPISMTTSFVLMFLIAEGFGSPLAPVLYPAAIIGVLLGALLGWRRLESGVKRELLLMAGQWIGRKGTL
jgi:O-antigen/teichoic acid export membrane protein